jgi:hypothetical protein
MQIQFWKNLRPENNTETLETSSSNQNHIEEMASLFTIVDCNIVDRQHHWDLVVHIEYNFVNLKTLMAIRTETRLT